MAMGPTILITGGTGSIGRTLVAAALLFDVTQRVIVLSRGAGRQADLARQFDDPRLELVLGDVRDAGALERAMRGGVDVVLHAAALSGAEDCDANPLEAIEINAVGTQNVVDAAVRSEVPRVVALSGASSQQAASLVGATQLCRERIVTRANARSGARATRLACVRSVPVAGSVASPVRRMQRQAREGDVLISSLESTCFWVSLERVIEVVQTAVRTQSGGEVFVPRAPAVRLQELAHELAPECRLLTTSPPSSGPEHDVLVHRQEAERAHELADMVVIRPAGAQRASARETSPGSAANGNPLSSQSTGLRLTGDDLRAALAELERMGVPGGRRLEDHPWAIDRAPRVGLEVADSLDTESHT